MQEGITFSTSGYSNEFAEHPDLACTWAVDTGFIARFAEGFAAYKSGDWQAACEIFEETRTARRTADGRKVNVLTTSQRQLLCVRQNLL